MGELGRFGTGQKHVSEPMLGGSARSFIATLCGEARQWKEREEWLCLW